MKFKVHTKCERIRISEDHRTPKLFIHSYELKKYQRIWSTKNKVYTVIGNSSSNASKLHGE